ncbi:protein ALP1-like [Folsomia candida]|uniref:protein ALP1-like n=1 Tax=Folsomia candida TaxID=158441 RepID=UPI001604BCAD|nr:protein ALP1-like [Folsomia candida]
MDDKEIVALILLRRRLIRQRSKRKCWIHPLNLLRPTLGEHLKLEMMYTNYPDKFFEYARMTPIQFDKVLGMVTLDITLQDTNYRLSIPPRQRLFIGLRYLVSGDSIKTIATSFSVGRSTVQNIIKSVNQALWKNLQPVYLKVPDKEKWMDIVKGFDEKWNFPNCLGAIDGKHVMIRAPPNSGSLFFNYKSFFSVVLLATCDADYRFTTVDIGGYGRQSDGGIFSSSALGRALDEDRLQIPNPLPLPGSNIVQPCTFVGDDAFALSDKMMKPYDQRGLDKKKRIFNYRLSRARRIIENVFGIIASRFNIYRRSIISDPENVVNAIKATVVLHNFLRTEELLMRPETRKYCPPGYFDIDDDKNVEWRLQGGGSGLADFRKNNRNNYTNNARIMRDNLCNYFMGNGSVEWQEERAFFNVAAV